MNLCNNTIDWDLIPVFLSKSVKLMNQRAFLALKPYNLSSAHAMFLIVLSKNDGLTLRNLSEILSVNKSQTTRIISDLKKKKYIYNDRENECSRNYKIYLTKEGQIIALHIKKVLAQLRENFITNCINKSEYEVFEKSVSKIITFLQTNEDINANESEQR